MRHVRGDRFFFTPGDYPLINRDVCRKLLAVDGDIVIPVVNGRKGHPVLMRREMVAEVLREDDRSNLRDFIERKGFTRLEVDDEGIMTDIDTQEDYQWVLNKWHGH